jgi:hypothetical protein
MNTHTFGNHSVTCPICQRTGSLKPVKICDGLFTCPYCQERLVVSWSGHYVRDPHNCKQETSAHLLRRQSQPWARILRDFVFVRRPAVIIAVGSAILLGVSVIGLESFNRQQNQGQGLLEQVTELVNPPQNSPEE